MDVISRIEPYLASHYRIQRELGAGGMATVYLAEDHRHHRWVAIKVLKPELAAVVGTARFLAEINVTARLQHPRIVPLFESGDASGLLYYVMPYIEGETLRQYLEREKQLPIEEAVRIAMGIASALDYAHRHGVIHRDLKPENILIHDGEPLVSDFGIALAITAARRERVTQTGLSFGTPNYMSPEQATGDQFDGRSDIYSIGAVLYEMLAGQPPHVGGSIQAITAKVVTDKPPSIRALRYTVPESLDAVVMRSLAKLPADRFKTAGDFGAALRQALAGDPFPPKPRKQIRRLIGPAKALVIGGALFVAATIVVVALAQTADKPSVWEVALPSGIDDVEDISMAGNRFGAGLALSPTANEFAVAADGRVYLKRFDRLDVEVFHNGEVADLKFSPNGKWLALCQSGVLLKSVEDAVALLLAPGRCRSVTWLDNVTLLADLENALWIISTRQTGPRLAVRAELNHENRSYAFPHALPGADAALVTIQTPGAAAQLGILDVASGKVDELGITGSDGRFLRGGYVLFARDTAGLHAVPFSIRRRKAVGSPVRLSHAVDTRQGGVMRLAVAENGTVVYRAPVDRNAREAVLAGLDGSIRTLLSEPRFYQWPRYSPRGDRVALTIVAGQRRDVWIYQLPRGPLVRLTTEGVLNDRPEWTPDGQSIIYRSNHGAFDELWIRPADGSGQTRPLLQVPGAHIAEGVFSSDGRFLVVQRDDGHGGTAWYRETTGDTVLKPLSTTAKAPQSNGFDARLSPDGKWVAYTSNESGSHQVYVRSFPSFSSRYQVSENGGLTPVWSRDGTRLFYAEASDSVSRGSRAIAVADVLLERGFQIVNRSRLPHDLVIEAPHANFDVTPDGTGVFAFRRLPGGSRHVVAERFDLQVKQTIRTARGQ
jgi:eukaryotic-like serine/threonine-protein kinase